MPARRISFLNFKGGVGKTSLSVNVAACLAHNFNQRVLLIDCDSQSNASIWLMGVARWNIINDAPEKSVYGIFEPYAPNIYNSVQRSVLRGDNDQVLIPKLDLLPATYDLMNLEDEYLDNETVPFYYRFYDKITPFFDQYDYIIFDCPPNVFRASKCALFASREVYVPCNPDVLSYIGLALLVKKVKKFQHNTVAMQQLIPGYRPAKLRGIILNAVDGRANYSDILNKMRARIQHLRKSDVVCDDADILAQRIRDSVEAGRVVGDNKPAVLARGIPGLKEDYINLCRYIHHTPLED